MLTALSVVDVSHDPDSRRGLGNPHVSDRTLSTRDACTDVRKSVARLWASRIVATATVAAKTLIARAACTHASLLAKWADEANSETVNLAAILAAIESGPEGRRWAETILRSSLARAGHRGQPAAAAERVASQIQADLASAIVELAAVLEDGVVTEAEAARVVPQMARLAERIEYALFVFGERARRA